VETATDAVRFSPNQLAKRQEIIEAAKRLLAREGLEACTARALAEDSSFSRASIHYYLGSMDEVIDAAMASHLTDFVAGLRQAGEAETDPVSRFWAAVRAYVDTLTRRDGLALVWFDYSIAAIRQGHVESATVIESALRETLGELLGACAVADVGVRTEAVVGYLIGTTLRGLMRPIPWSDARAQLALISGLAPPA
jgi:AcrR family transcriptional regulator